ncbi:hypothetical protein GGI42DRAFT_330504 [Trichoderma sp. SZMC 28013]
MLFLGSLGVAAGCLALPQYSMCRWAAYQRRERRCKDLVCGKRERDGNSPENKTTTAFGEMVASCIYLFVLLILAILVWMVVL